MPAGLILSAFLNRQRVPRHNKWIGLSHLAHGEDWVELGLPEQSRSNSCLTMAGTVTAMLDMAGALCAMLRAGRPTLLATIDMRADYLSAVRPSVPISCHARYLPSSSSEIVPVQGTASHGMINIPLLQFVASYWAMDKSR
jgi:acyl-coenzyme A thioesterase PaaI-like protein